MKVKVALAQMDIVLGDPTANLAQVSAWAATAATEGVDWLVLPELWSTGYDLARADHHATAVTTGISAEIATLAQRHHLHIVGSALSRLPGGGYGNTAVWHTPTGEIAGDYTKLHLFRLMQEEQFLTAGNHPTTIPAPWGETGLAICYDLRFPELFRQYALGGAAVVVIPAEWPHPRLAHWQTLLRARAIENQCFIVACNRVGHVGATHFCGHSCVIDPWGEVVIEGDETSQLLVTEIETDRVSEVRAKIPVFADRREDVYGAS